MVAKSPSPQPSPMSIATPMEHMSEGVSLAGRTRPRWSIEKAIEKARVEEKAILSKLGEEKRPIVRKVDTLLGDASDDCWRDFIEREGLSWSELCGADSDYDSPHIKVALAALAVNLCTVAMLAALILYAMLTVGRATAAEEAAAALAAAEAEAVAASWLTWVI